MHLLVVLDITVTLNELCDLVSSVASKKQVVCWSNSQSEAHEETRIDAES
jgi:hypothetical protein